MKLGVIFALSSVALLALLFALVSGAGPSHSDCAQDTDMDGVCNDPSPFSDNCTAIANPGQRDDDEDGYGNVCDSDVNQDCFVGGPDLGMTFARIFSAAPWSPKSDGAFDVNEDGVVGGPDLGQIFADSFLAPGPSSRTCADCLAAVGTGVCP